MTHDARRMTKHEGHARAYIAVWLALLVLTVTTVSVSYFNFGNWNVFIAMLVASIKGALVCLYFMHLKYDNRLNQVVFVSAFLFLGIFVGLTASDELMREPEESFSVKEEAVDVNQFLVATPELTEEGKKLFAVQCAACHGATGNGSGMPSLNPPPRDFTSGFWRFGGEVTHVFHTITNGSPGTSMAGFPNLSVKARLTLVHFVRSLHSPQPEDKPEEIEAFKKEFGGGGQKGGAVAATGGGGPKIPLSFAIHQVTKPPPGFPDDSVVNLAEGAGLTPGEKLYQTNCVSCHGVHGRGGINVAKVGFQPFSYLKTRNFSESTGAWVQDRQAFVDMVSQGLPGFGKPGISHFSSEEWDALYQYVQSLRH